MYEATTTYLVSPNWSYTPTYCTYTYINLVAETSVFSTSTLWALFSFFYSLFFARTKSTKIYISKQMTFLTLDVFKRIFYCCFCSLVAFCVFAWLRLCAFVLLVLLVLLVRAKKIKSLKLP